MAANGGRGMWRGLLGLVVATVSTAAFSLTSDPASATTSSLRGTSAADAAASCWEIKQRHPSSQDGVYWLRTGAMPRPEQFFCEMDDDGGGWVLIGRGREGWTFREYGQGTTANVRNVVDGPGAFAPAALSSDVVDGLLDGRAVRDLADGVRIRRAANVDGTMWQEIRWKFLDLTTWSWAFGGGHRLSTWSVGAVSGTGSNTRDSAIAMWGEIGAGNRGAPDWQRWFTYPWAAHGKQAGFSYGASVSGGSSATSYLWEATTENHAVAFTQLFVRPRTTTPALAPIPDHGLPAQTLAPLLDDRPAVLAGGVSGVLKVGDSQPEIDSSVLAITTHGDRVYVGGKFAQVRDPAGNLVSRAYLAAFDRSTGAWIGSFSPVLDGTVWDLEVAGGRLIVAGQFSSVNGVANTAGLAALDLVTGAVDPSWRASMILTGSSARPEARSIVVDGPWIYVGGNFTRIQGPSVLRLMARLGRVSVADGTPDNSFRPDVDGIPAEIDVAGGRVHVAGDFAGVNGVSSRGYAVVDAVNGALVGGIAPPVWTTGNEDRRYLYGTIAVANDVWTAGSEHSVQRYDRTTNALRASHVAWGNGGDFQALAEVGGVVYAAGHGNSWIAEDAVAWPGLDGYSRMDDFRWIGALDAGTGRVHRSWVPSLASANDEGVWALHVDPDGCLWFGGDIAGGPFVNGQRQYLEGFSKFCPRDTQAPTTPTSLSASPEAGGMRLTWPASVDDRPGAVGYEVLRNDRVVSPLVYGTTYVDPAGNPGDRYFVRAVDQAGNRSSSTRVAGPRIGVPAGSKTEIVGRPNGIAVVSLGTTQTQGGGYFQLLGCDEQPGAYSNLNADRAGQTIANLAVVQLDHTGRACVYNQSAAHVFVDLQGYLDPAAFTPTFQRLVDTRQPGPGRPPIGAGGRVEFTGAPNGLAVVSIVATETSAPGYLQALPCTATPGEYSNLNVDRSGQTIANLAVVQLDAAGKSCVYTQGGGHVIVDLQGYLAPSAFDPADTRLLDTRDAGRGSPVPAGGRAGVAGQPDRVAVLSVVATQTTGGGYLQVLPCGAAPGAYSNLNADRAGQTIANLAVARLDGTGSACVYTQGGGHLIADLQGYFSAWSFEAESRRLIDTRSP